MTVSKLTNNVKPLDEVDKINEIIDELDNIDPLPSQTGKAGKFLQTDGTDASWESAPFRNIGEIVASTIPLTDAGLHLLDGALIQGSGIYSAFVTYIAGLVSTYPNLFVTENDWQTAVSTYGVCGKFVYDSVNNTVRLPKVTGKLDGTTDVSVLGDLEPLVVKLPNITGSFQIGSGNAIASYSQTGAFYGTNSSTNDRYGGGSSSNTYRTTNFDASRSSSVYSGNGTDTTIHEQAINVLLYIVIATSTKTDIQVDIDEIATDLNGKADVDLANLSSGLANTICTIPATTTSTASSATPAVAIENYVNGASWYRVYSDGWCEQGGYAPSGTNSVTLLKPYVNTNYNIQISSTYNGNTYSSNPTNKTTTSFNFVYNGSAAQMWQACGYIN